MKIRFIPTERSGFTLIEVLITMVLTTMLVMAGISTLTLLYRSSHRQALHTSALEIAQGRLEELHAIPYDPPQAPFTAASTNYATNVLLTLKGRIGTTNVVRLITDLVPVAQGHLATVTVNATNGGQGMSVQLQTIINQMSGGQ